MKLLFICSYNVMRSRTAEVIYAEDSKYQVKSAGIFISATKWVSPELVCWADMIFVMEARHEYYLRKRHADELGDKKVAILDIPDRYRFMDPVLVEILKTRIQPYLDY